MQIILFVVFAGGALLGNGCAQVLLHRLIAPGQLVFSLVGGVIWGFFILALELVLLLQISASIPDQAFWGHMVAALLIYLSCSFTFLIFVSGSQTSVRLEILRVLRGHKDGLAMSELDLVYDNRTVVGRRLDRLLTSGKVSLVDGRYRLTSPMLLLVAHFFRGCRMAIYGISSEFELAKGAQRRMPDWEG